LGSENFETNVFINCPFDKEYSKLLKPLLFIIIRSGLDPRIASERLDSGEVRLEKIIQLIKSSMFGIHDLSRCKAKKEGEYSRFNLPFELAIDYSIREFTNYKEPFKNKKILILEEEKYSVQKALSDLAFSDAKCHKGEPEEMVYEVRSWFYEAGFTNISSPSELWDSYNIFYSDLYVKKQEEGFSKKAIERLPVPEFLDEIRNWCSNNS
jgi:hypothetical protein